MSKKQAQHPKRSNPRPERPEDARDKLTAQLYAGEARRHLENMKEIVANNTRMMAQAEDERTREVLRLQTAQAKGLMVSLEQNVQEFDAEARWRMHWDDALDFMCKEWDRGELEGWTGYIDLYRTEERISAERFKAAAASLGLTMKIVNESDGFWAYTLYFKDHLELLDYIEDIQDDEPEDTNND